MFVFNPRRDPQQNSANWYKKKKILDNIIWIPGPSLSWSSPPFQAIVSLHILIGVYPIEYIVSYIYPNMWENKWPFELFLCCLFNKVWVVFLFFTTIRVLSSILLNNIIPSPPRPHIIFHSYRCTLRGKEDGTETSIYKFWKCINNKTGVLVPYVM